jgi:hypothetical protein
MIGTLVITTEIDFHSSSIENCLEKQSQTKTGAS